MHRLTCFALLAVAAFASTASAQQQSVPPSAPTIGASGGVGGGIAIPLGTLNTTHSAGYTLSGLVDFSAADQPYSFRAEAVYQRYDRKSAAPTGMRSVNMLSFGAAVLARSPRAASSAFVIGGIGVYHLTDRGTKPGVNAGAGIEVPLTFFIGMADVRLHYVLTDGKPAVTIPITLGARF
ncbi:MAG TPA: hypothetical protein VFT29_03760 [Gemmatimonadaceae bacterium]|nr:hypothetical protein [Gemmatimonadaceae bacterium]